MFNGIFTVTPYDKCDKVAEDHNYSCFISYKHNVNNLSGAGCIYVMSFMKKESKLALVKCTV